MTNDREKIWEMINKLNKHLERHTTKELMTHMYSGKGLPLPSTISESYVEGFATKLEYEMAELGADPNALKYELGKYLLFSTAMSHIALELNEICHRHYELD